MENANGSTVMFTHAGIKAKGSVDFATGEGRNETMTEMMTYSCKYSSTRHALKQDYENTDFNLPGAGGYMRDDIEAYCGERAVENQERIFHSYWGHIKEIDAIKNPWLCFAVKGLSYIGRVSLLFIWKDTRNRNRRDWIGVNNVFTPSAAWHYQCVNMPEIARNQNISWIANDMHEKSYIKVQDIIIIRGTVVDNFYMDDITVSPLEVKIVRKGPAFPNDNVIVNKVEVQQVLNETAY